MAKKKAAGGNKSQAIRDYKAANPTAMPSEIAQKLTEQGFDLNAGFVSTVLSTAKRKTKVGRRGRPKGSKNKQVAGAVGRPRKTDSGATISVDSLIKAKKWVDEIGGIDEAKSAIETLERLMK
ncbi:hypothetical protein Pla22_04290 [Rubripirellula amarantea]|uniref:Uncharacterized protein n=1 Tax=Rubripirellula amarantea TaxID=2527999 RepID=A0A5C5WSM4_9BACT|nr:hypothetical protein [Rubripirellula amarantea]TWT52802.1 hypothetical protein Pla22_04290 [Rubripirellula amarantea]